MASCCAGYTCTLNVTDLFLLLKQIVDTPGVCDTERNEDEVKHEISRCLLLTEPGPHAVLFSINANARLTREEYGAYQSLRQHFDPILYRFIIIVFTHADELGPPDVRQKNLERNLKDHEAAIAKAQKETNLHIPNIRDILEEIGDRYVMFGNKDDLAEKKAQVQRLMKTIKVMQSVNHVPYFSDSATAEETTSKERRLIEIMRDQEVSREKAFELLVEEFAMKWFREQSRSEAPRGDNNHKASACCMM
jgi:ribosome biogenesis GTPase A